MPTPIAAPQRLMLDDAMMPYGAIFTIMRRHFDAMFYAT